MREILFRGKRIDNGEWVYGMLCNVLWDGELEVEPAIQVSDELEMFAHPVIPETVEQYTGLDDKNGVKIFEGDILKGAMRNLIVAYKGAGFIAYWNDHDYGYGTEQMWCNLVEGGEVIGNIHDNPELMEGKK